MLLASTQRPAPLLYAVDVVRVVTGKDQSHSGEVLRRLAPEVFDVFDVDSKMLIAPHLLPRAAKSKDVVKR